MVEVLLLNIGNTHTQIALGHNGEVSQVTRLRTADLLSGAVAVPDVLTAHAVLPCLVASVVPAVNSVLTGILSGPVEFVRAALIAGIDFSLVDMAGIGADRLANAAAALEQAVPPLIVLDCGTAVTTEVIDGRHRFCGGAIMPGRAMLRRALRVFTGQLPEIDMQNALPPAIGRNTKEAICSGVDLGILGAVDRLVRETQREAGIEGCPVIVTGGDQDYFVAANSRFQAGGENFTLRGMAKIARSVFG